MLLEIKKYHNLDKKQLMDVYAESNLENTDYFYPGEADKNTAIQKVEAGFLDFYPNIKAGTDFPTTLINAVAEAGNKFILIIDEWDAPIRECPEIQMDYLQFLRSLFKNSGHRYFRDAPFCGQYF